MRSRTIEATYREVQNPLDELARGRPRATVWRDWCEACAIALANAGALQDEVWHAREERYKAILANYPKDAQALFPKAFGALQRCFESQPFADHLGTIYMMAMSTGEKGQFFTPYNISLLTARATLEHAELPPDRNLVIGEPSCGSGGMLIATCQVLHERGIDFQAHVDLHGDDIDWCCVHMATIQLSLIGARAWLRQGDSLTYDFAVGRHERNFETPFTWMGPLVGKFRRHEPWTEAAPAAEPARARAENAAPVKKKAGQLSLF